MKGFMILFVALAFVKTEETRDWSQIKPAYRGVYPNRLGVVPSDIRIVGGDEVIPNSLPHQAGLFISTSSGTSFCGGSVISKNFILTAAHCVYGSVTSVEVVLGAHHIRETEATQQRIVSTTFIIHEEYDNLFIRNDIAIIALPSDITFNDYVQPIDLPTRAESSNSFAGDEATASGWGRPSDSVSTISDVLRYVDLTVITNLECFIRYPLILRDSNICTSGVGGKGTCNGDSGGPLAVNGVLVGIVSFGSAIGCEIGIPAAYTRVTSYLDWIETHSNVVIV